MDFLNRKYTAQSVALATGATPKQITDWCNQGLIVGQREPLGRGHKRSFSWFNVMEIAGALALMEIGIRAPGDAFRAAAHFAHFAPGGSGWVREDGTLEGNDDPKRWPGMPYHHNAGETFLAVAGTDSQVLLSSDDKLDAFGAFPVSRRPVGLILLNMTEVFDSVCHRMALDGSEVLDAAYPSEAS